MFARQLAYVQERLANFRLTIPVNGGSTTSVTTTTTTTNEGTTNTTITPGESP